MPGSTPQLNGFWLIMKVLPKMYLWTRKSPLTFGSHPVLDPDQRVF